jgi:hypothetical protein
MADTEILTRTIQFVRSVGISVEERPIARTTLVPGVDIVDGGLVIDTNRLCRPADILHEAAHIALTNPSDRVMLDGTISSSPAEEMAAIGWTWAAARHLQIEAEDVFHDEVISGNGPWLREMFIEGSYVGVPMLEYWGLAARRKPDVCEPKPYPYMIRWVRQ